MIVLDVLALSAIANNGMRTVLFALLLVAIVLLLAGGSIALLTLRSQLRGSSTPIAPVQLESEHT